MKTQQEKINELEWQKRELLQALKMVIEAGELRPHPNEAPWTTFARNNARHVIAKVEGQQ
jgi:hypothetical protein